MIDKIELQRFSLYPRNETLFELIREDYCQVSLGPISFGGEGGGGKCLTESGFHLNFAAISVESRRHLHRECT